MLEMWINDPNWGDWWPTIKSSFRSLCRLWEPKSQPHLPRSFNRKVSHLHQTVLNWSSVWLDWVDEQMTATVICNITPDNGHTPATAAVLLLCLTDIVLPQPRRPAIITPCWTIRGESEGDFNCRRRPSFRHCTLLWYYNLSSTCTGQSVSWSLDCWNRSIPRTRVNPRNSSSCT